VAFVGGGWFSEGTAVCLRGCVTEIVSLSATRFINNSATEGAAIYLLSAARHVLGDVEWIGNYGLSSENYIHSDAIVSRGAAVYCGLLGMNISIDGATMLDNVAEEASAISIRSSIFTASLTISNSHIEDSVSETMLKFRHIPQWSITILNSTIWGVVFFSNGASVVADRTNFSTLTIEDGGRLQLAGAEVEGLTLQYASPCVGSSEVIASSGSQVKLYQPTDYSSSHLSAHML